MHHITYMFCSDNIHLRDTIHFCDTIHLRITLHLCSVPTPYNCLTLHSRRRSDLRYMDLQICPVFPDNLLSDGDPVYSRETLLIILGTPEKTCLICTGDSRENMWEILAVEIVLCLIFSVRGYICVYTIFTDA